MPKTLKVLLVYKEYQTTNRAKALELFEKANNMGYKATFHNIGGVEYKVTIE